MSEFSRVWNWFCLADSYESMCLGRPASAYGHVLLPVNKKAAMATHLERMLELIGILMSSLINTALSLLKVLYEFGREKFGNWEPFSNGVRRFFWRLISHRAILIIVALIAIVLPGYSRIKTWYTSYRPPVFRWSLRQLQGRIVAIDVAYRDGEKKFVSPDKSSIRFVNSKFGTTNTFYALTLNGKGDLKVFSHEMTADDLKRIARFYRDLATNRSVWEHFTLESKMDPRRPLPDQGAYPFAIERSSYIE